MSKIQIITDSASDISKEMEQKYNLDVISYSIVIGDKTYTSRVDFDNEGCYELMEASESLPMTSQITAFQFMELYYDYYQKGCTDLIFILINGKGSATYNNSLMACNAFFQISVNLFYGPAFLGHLCCHYCRLSVTSTVTSTVMTVK